MGRDDDQNGFGDWGGYFEAKKSKLEEQFAAASDPFRKSNLFIGISIFVNGLTNPSADELKRVMMVHGGTFHHYERPHTKFIIASNLPDVKVRNMDTSRIISAQWIVDCIEQKRIIDYKSYLLYTNQKTTQPRLTFKKNENASAVNISIGNNPTDLSKTKSEDLGGILKDLQQAAATAPIPDTSLNLTKTKTDSNAALTAVDPSFLSEFFKKSRLHHIATLSAGFKQYVSELRQAHGNKPFQKRAALSFLPKSNRSGTCYVMHIDMDCFFVSVGLKKYPELRGLPIAVTHSKGGSSASEVPVHPQANRQVEQELFTQRFEHHLHDNTRADKVRSGFKDTMSLSEIASCSYEARDKGIRNGMFVGQALKLCPELRTIPYDFEGYHEVAFQLYKIIAQYTLNIEAVSCDELFVELTDLVQELQIDVMEFVKYVREEVREMTGCPCSAGVAENKLLARMATKKAKPNGQYLLEHKDVAAYMAPIALETLPGVGHGLSFKLSQAGLKTCGDMQKCPLNVVETILGKKVGQTIYQNCRGIDLRPLVYDQQRKSVSAEVNYGIRFKESSECITFMRQLCVEVHSRLIEIKRKTMHITLKLMVRAAEAPVETSKFMGHGVCDTQSRSVSLKQSTDALDTITHNVLDLMRLSDVPANELRGIGIHLSKFDDIEKDKKENVILKMFAKITDKQKANPLSNTSEVPLEKEPKNKPTSVLDMLHKSKANRKSTDANVLSKTADVSTEKETEPKPTSILDILHKSRANRVSMDGMETNKIKKGSTPKRRKSNPQLGTQADGPNRMSLKFMDLTKNITTNDVGLTDKSNAPPIKEVQNDFDPEVFAQLPSNIQKELVLHKEEYLGLLENNQTNYDQELENKPRTIERSPLAQLIMNESPLKPEDFLPSTSKAAQKQQILRSERKATEKNLKAKKCSPEELPEMKVKEHDPSNNSVTLLNNDFKSVLCSWVSSTEHPSTVDVSMVSEEFVKLVAINETDRIYEAMKYMCRLIKSKRNSNCFWHLAYAYIEDHLQDEMLKIHCHHLLLIESINCNTCRSKIKF